MGSFEPGPKYLADTEIRFVGRKPAVIVLDDVVGALGFENRDRLMRRIPDGRLVSRTMETPDGFTEKICAPDSDLELALIGLEPQDEEEREAIEGLEKLIFDELLDLPEDVDSGGDDTSSGNASTPDQMDKTVDEMMENDPIIAAIKEARRERRQNELTLKEIVIDDCPFEFGRDLARRIIPEQLLETRHRDAQALFAKMLYKEVDSRHEATAQEREAVDLEGAKFVGGIARDFLVALPDQQRDKLGGMFRDLQKDARRAMGKDNLNGEVRLTSEENKRCWLRLFSYLRATHCTGRRDREVRNSGTKLGPMN